MEYERVPYLNFGSALAKFYIPNWSSKSDVVSNSTSDCQLPYILSRHIEVVLPVWMIPYKFQASLS
jgi:hypothetical protein